MKLPSSAIGESEGDGPADTRATCGFRRGLAFEVDLRCVLLAVCSPSIPHITARQQAGTPAMPARGLDNA